MENVRVGCHLIDLDVNGRMSSGVHKFFKKSRSHLKIIGARNVIWNKFHNEDTQMLGATVQNLVATATWRPDFAPVYWEGFQVGGRGLN